MLHAANCLSIHQFYHDDLLKKLQEPKKQAPKKFQNLKPFWSLFFAFWSFSDVYRFC